MLAGYSTWAAATGGSQEDFIGLRGPQMRGRLQPPAAPALTDAEKIAALRAELDGLKARLKDELIEELRIEVEKAIALRLEETYNTDNSDNIDESDNTHNSDNGLEP